MTSRRYIQFEKVWNNPVVYIWHNIYIVKISSIPDNERFKEWLDGQTLPYVEEDDNPTDWAYYADYSRWTRKLRAID